MALVARASTTVRNKNIILILLCAIFTAWFAYDGFHAWPTKNDALVKQQIAAIGTKVDPSHGPALREWKSWQESTSAQRAEMTRRMENLHVEGWHSEFDINVQRYIVIGLAVATLAAIWWFFHCQRRRAIADDQGLSPAPGLFIPWNNITVIDNTRWKSTGIVDVTYVDANNTEQKTVLDDYQLDNLPPVLNEVAERATQAKLIPPPGEPAPPSTPATEPTNTPPDATPKT